jgi:GAF domain-containing protein
MSSQNSPDQAGELKAALEMIARQEKEIQFLRLQVARDESARNLHRILALAASTAAVSSPVDHHRLLEMIVEAAAGVINAASASLFLIDEATQELVFEVALGQKAQAVKQFRVPLGHGIAGLVAVSGQPIAVSNADQDVRQASDIAQAVGYKPKSILCVPLFFEDRITGVLELLDKQGAANFSPNDMYILGLFANQAAVAIELSSTTKNLDRLLARLLEAQSDPVASKSEQLKEYLRLFDSDTEAQHAYTRALTMAQLVQEITWRGENEARACQAILQSFANYLKTSSELLWNGGSGY